MLRKSPKISRRIAFATVFLSAVWIAAAFLGGSLIADENYVASVGSGNWSDPTTWEQAKVPGEGDRVEISIGTVVDYDLYSQSEIREIVIYGMLRFSREADTNLDVGTVTVNPGGALEIGTETQPIPSNVKAIIRIVNEEDGENSIDVYGSVDMHGEPINYVYTHLSRDAEVGSNKRLGEDNVGWRPGDLIVIASTTQNPRETETAHVMSVNGNVISLQRPLRYWHGAAANAGAEVANLTRNVVITSKNPKFRGHTRFFEGADARIS